MKASLRCRAMWRGRCVPADPQDFLARLPGEVRAAKEAGAGALEFPLELVAIDDRYAEPALWQDVARILRGEAMAATVHLPSVWVDLAALDREVWEGGLRSLERALRAVAPLSPELAAFHPANFGAQAVFATTPPAEAGEVVRALAERLVEGVARLRAVARRLASAAPLALENLEGIPWPLFEQVAAMAEVPVCVDVGHAISNGDDPAACVRRMAGRVAGIHLHDAVPPEPGARVGRAHLPLGEGRLDLRALVLALDHAGVAGPVVLEVEPVPEPLGREPEDEAELARRSLSVWLRAVNDARARR